ncbi:MAG: hypothetical protein AAGG01_06950, partial [Planctomycetota bacterium]
DGGEVKRTTVEVGLDNSKWVSINEGLTEGMVVALAPPADFEPAPLPETERPAFRGGGPGGAGAPQSGRPSGRPSGAKEGRGGRPRGEGGGRPAASYGKGRPEGSASARPSGSSGGRSGGKSGAAATVAAKDVDVSSDAPAPKDASQ